ncbi:hypothetical protein FRC11_013074, partial [Ceratobasidium sp. 423]
NGYILGSVAAGKTIYLLLFFPFILKAGHRFYLRNRLHGTEAKDLPGSQFDVHLLAFSFLIESLGLLGAGLSTSKIVANACITIMILGSGAAPCISTLVSTSVEPLAQGEALAMVALIRSIAEFLSPVILGSILSSTTNTRLPGLVFVVSSILLLLAVGIVVFIRDTDKYAPPDNSSNHPDPTGGE